MKKRQDKLKSRHRDNKFPIYNIIDPRKISSIQIMSIFACTGQFCRTVAHNLESISFWTNVKKTHLLTKNHCLECRSCPSYCGVSCRWRVVLRAVKTYPSQSGTIMSTPICQFFTFTAASQFTLSIPRAGACQTINFFKKNIYIKKPGCYDEPL